MSRYVALGSSFASGPGLPARTAYPYLVARRLGLDLTDVSLSGATTAHVLRDEFRGRPPQLTALDGTEDLVTITIAGNDVGMSLLTMTAALPRVLRVLLPVRRALDPAWHLTALDHVGDALREVVSSVRERSPAARVVLVDYLTVLPPEWEPAPPLSAEHADLVRTLAKGLRKATAEVAEAEGCLLVRASVASADHHAWSAEPWTTGATLPLPRRPVAFHPNVAGMRAVADLVVSTLEA